MFLYHVGRKHFYSSKGSLSVVLLKGKLEIKVFVLDQGKFFFFYLM